MKWKMILTVGAGIVGGVALAARHRNQKTLADASLWAEATDPVTPFGES